MKDKLWPRVEQILADAPKWTGGKQRLTSVRLHELLVAEGHDVGERTVREMVAERKRRRQEVFVPLVYKPGDLAEVDFFEVLVDVAGRRQKAWMFVMRLMYSGRDFAWLYPRQDQVAFPDGHVRAFGHFGGVPQRLAYDNLKAAVSRILVGSERQLAARFLALTTHYLFEASFARPGTGHDKGGMVPLPAAPFRAASFHEAEPSRRSLVPLAGAAYSVWSDWAKRPVEVFVGVDEVQITGPDGRTVVHPRQPFGGRAVDDRHYLPELAKKPQAVRQVADELIRDLGAPFDALWGQISDQSGPKQAARTFAHVLRAVVDLGERVTAERVERALASGEPVLLALRPSDTAPPSMTVEALPSRLRDIDVVSGRAADYDQLLGRAE